MRSNLVDYSFKISDSLLNAQAQFLAEVNNNVFYTSSRGLPSNIIVSSNAAARRALFWAESWSKNRGIIFDFH